MVNIKKIKNTVASHGNVKDVAHGAGHTVNKRSLPKSTLIKEISTLGHGAKKARLDDREISSQSRSASLHDCNVSSGQLSHTPQHQLFEKRIAHYIPLTSQTTGYTDGAKMVDHYVKYANADIRHRSMGSEASQQQGFLRDANHIVYYGHGNNNGDKLSYYVSPDAPWHDNKTHEGYHIVEEGEGVNTKHYLVITPQEFLNTLKSEGFDPDNFSGTIQSHACQGVQFLKDFMQLAWPSGNPNVIGIANEWDIIRPTQVSANNFHFFLDESMPDSPRLCPAGSQYKIEFPQGTLDDNTEWAGININGVEHFRPKEYTDVELRFSGTQIEMSRTGPDSFAQMAREKIEAYRPIYVDDEGEIKKMPLSRLKEVIHYEALKQASENPSLDCSFEIRCATMRTNDELTWLAQQQPSETGEKWIFYSKEFNGKLMPPLKSHILDNA